MGGVGLQEAPLQTSLIVHDYHDRSAQCFQNLTLNITRQNLKGASRYYVCINGGISFSPPQLNPTCSLPSLLSSPQFTLDDVKCRPDNQFEVNFWNMFHSHPQRNINLKKFAQFPIIRRATCWLSSWTHDCWEPRNIYFWWIRDIPYHLTRLSAQNHI